MQSRELMHMIQTVRRTTTDPLRKAAAIKVSEAWQRITAIAHAQPATYQVDKSIIVPMGPDELLGPDWFKAARDVVMPTPTAA